MRDRSHWNSANIKPRDPVILGLCTQSALNASVSAVQEKLRAEGIAAAIIAADLASPEAGAILAAAILARRFNTADGIAWGRALIVWQNSPSTPSPSPAKP